MTDETPPTSLNRNPLMEEAALWFARMRGPEAEAHRAAFENWLARGALHRSAFNRAGEIFSIGKFLEGDQPAATGPEVDLPSSATTKRAVINRKHLLPLFLIGAIIAIGIGWALVAQSGPRRSEPDQSIAKSDKRETSLRLSTDAAAMTRRLEDGSTVVLQPETVLVVAFDGTQRTLRLERGVARFDVAHEQRPFIVFAGGGTVTARGTVFEVRVAPDARVTVELIRGRVDVSMPQANRTAATVSHLGPGQTVSFPAVPANGSPPVPVSTLSTANGIRDFDGLRLDELLIQANAVNATKIRLADPGLGARAVSGRFTIDNPRKLAERLAWIFGGRVTTDPSGNLILSGG